MKIVLISEYSRFTTIGGTEYYVDVLAEGLAKSGYEVILIAKGNDAKETGHFFELTKSNHRYEVFLIPAMPFTIDEIKQKKVSRSWKLIFPLLKIAEPDIIHVHTSTTFFNIRHLEHCTRYFKNIFFTTHIPGHFCAKGDLIQNDRKPCDGKIGLKCYACMFTKSAVNGTSNLLFRYSSKKLHTLITMNRLGIQVICPSAWQKEQLLRNGYNEKNIRVIRQAIDMTNYQPVKAVKRNKKFSIGYLGRLSVEKGSSLLINFIRSYKGKKDIRFVVGIPANSDEIAMAELKELANSEDYDILWMSSVGNGNKQDFFSQIDCLFIPSYCVETGPVVLLEAAFYKKPVVAPDTGGPAEFAREIHPVYLYKWNDPVAAGQIINNLQNRQQEVINNEAVLQKYSFTFLADHLLAYLQSCQP